MWVVVSVGDQMSKVRIESPDGRYYMTRVTANGKLIAATDVQIHIGPNKMDVTVGLEAELDITAEAEYRVVMMVFVGGEKMGKNEIFSATAPTIPQALRGLADVVERSWLPVEMAKKQPKQIGGTNG